MVKKQQDKILADAIGMMDCHRGLEYSHLFDEFLDLSLCLLCNNPNNHQQELASRLNEDSDYRNAFTAAMEAYGIASEDYHDPLGDVYMDRISHGHLDQFFTPENLATLLAKICGSDFLTCNDPTCGSGRLLIAGLKNARDHGVEPWICGEDLSYTCIRMATLNMLIHQARGILRCGDTLRYDQYKMQYFQIERVFLMDGRIISTYWQYSPSEKSEISNKMESWRKLILSYGFWPELPPPSSLFQNCEIIDVKDNLIESNNTLHQLTIF